jgi:hypothetical protein
MRGSGMGLCFSFLPPRFFTAEDAEIAEKCRLKTTPKGFRQGSVFLCVLGGKKPKHRAAPQTFSLTAGYVLIVNGH